MRCWLVYLVLAAGVAAAAPADKQRTKEAEARYAAGSEAFDAGDLPRAVEELKASLAARPMVKTCLALGNVYLRLGQLDDARDAFKKVMEIDPRSPKRKLIEENIRALELLARTRVAIVSEPPGATVYVDLKSEGARGKTPLTMPMLPGRHRLMLELADHEPWTGEVVAVEGQDVVAGGRLLALKCAVEISVSPPEARVAVDGAEPVKLPAPPLLVERGEHKLVFSADGHEPRERTVSCSGAEGRLSLDVSLSPTAPVERFGKLRLDSTPEGVEVRCEGATPPVVAAPTILLLSPGSHPCSFKKRGYLEKSASAEVLAGQEAHLAMTLELRPEIAAELAEERVVVRQEYLDYEFADGRGDIRENEFIRRYRKRVGSDLDHHYHMRTRALLGVSIGGMIAGTVPQIWTGIFMSLCLQGNLDDQHGNTVPKRSCFTGENQSGFNATVAPMFYIALILPIASTIGMSLAGKYSDGTVRDHSIPISDAEDARLRYNQALFQRLTDHAPP
jgi:PEGA domain/Tetratricopeptide repeat